MRTDDELATVGRGASPIERVAIGVVLAVTMPYWLPYAAIGSTMAVGYTFGICLAHVTHPNMC